MKSPAGFLLAALLLPGISAAQQAEVVPRTAASVELNLFNLDVVVTDAKGKPVHGLKAVDFEVRHDGRPVQVTNFSEIRGGAMPAGSAEAPDPPDAPARPGDEPGAGTAASRPPRRIVLFFDRLQMPDARQRGELFGSIRGFLEKSLGEGDEAMIVTWSRTIRTVQPFTGDPDRLDETLQSIERQSGRIATEKAELDMLRAEDSWFTQLAEEPAPGSGYLQPIVGTDFGGYKPSAELAAQQAYFEMKAKTAALKGLTATLGGMDGRKVLVFVSHRFSRYAGLEFFLKSRSDVSDLGDPRTRQFDTKRYLEDVTRSANANGVTLYAVLPSGLESPQPSAAETLGIAPEAESGALGGREELALNNEMEALAFVAEKTGGVATVGAGSVPAFIERVSADLDSSYSLGYPAPAGGGRAASVSVRLRNRELKVRVRGSLVEKTLEEQMKDRVLAHLFKPDGQARIPIWATSTAAPGPKGKYRIRVEIHIPIASLVLLPTAKGVGGTFSVFVASVAPEGDFSEVTRKSQPFEVPGQDVETAKAGHYTYELEIESAGPEARVCVGVWDEKGNEAGFAVVKPSGS